ncbi:ParA family protein [Pantoea sp. B9002]|uniref:ParA family protein n=1 Tax=Pantoea sp. B9002 TaxID=2726979 RepID=UPI002103AFDD|nr:AAA family ATPase [Pantoea sp. B9002]
MTAKIIATTNNKGGSGKTSTDTNVAHELAKQGNKVLLIDSDQQANATEVLARGRKYYSQFGNTICDVYSNQRFDIRKAIVPAVIPKGDDSDEEIENLFLLPSDPSFERVLDNCLTRHHREKILHRAMQPIMDDYDYIIIDCAPGLNLSTSNAVYAADHILIPIDGGSFALTGLEVVLDFVNEVREGDFNNFSVFRNEYNASKKIMNEFLHDELVNNPRVMNHILKTRIRADESIAQAQVRYEPLSVYNRGSLALNDYRNLARELIDILKSKKDRE